MSVESSKSRNKYQDDLMDLQAEYARKKKKLIQQNEGEIDTLQENHQSKKAALNLQNEAAVNHIQKNNQETLAKYSASQNKAAEISRVKTDQLQEEYNTQIDQMQIDRTEAIGRINEQKKAKLDEITASTEGKVADARANGKRDIEKIKNQYKIATDDQNLRSSSKLELTREQSDQQINSEKSRGERAQDKVRLTYENQIKKLHQDGEAQAQHEKNMSAKKLQKVDDNFKKNYDKTQQSWALREKNMNEGFVHKLEDQKETHNELLISETKHFEKTYDKRELDNKVALDIQDGRYTKQLINEKRKFTREAGKYSGKEEDPFYKISDRGSRVRETTSSYIVEAFSPEHEKDLVRVTVDRSKAVISGQRAFNDKIEDDNKKVTTDNFQSFREEFKFAIPVATEAMVRERRGDYIVFEIPKMSAVDSSTIKFSKKV